MSNHLRKGMNMEYDCLIDNGLLMTMEHGLPVIENGAVLIKNGVIEACGQTNSFSDVNAKIYIKADNKIIMPGLINCHTHLPMSMFRGLADDLPLDVWLNEHIFPAEAKYVNPDSVENWSLHSCRELLLSGTTTCCDGYFYEQNVARAVTTSGIRAVAGQGVIDFPAPGVPDPKQNIHTAIEFVKQYQDVSPLLSPSIFCHSPYTCSNQTLKAAKQAANDLDVLFQIHAAETQNEINMVKDAGGLSVIAYLESLGILDEKTLIVHSVWISEDDISIIQQSGANVVHCPESNMKLASGVAPIPKLIENNIPVGLGTDGCASNNDHDLFSEMDMAAKLHKVVMHDPCVMDARTTLKMATIQGAKAIGLDTKIGSIEKGKQADIILVDISKPHLVPLFDPFSSIVYSAKSSDVSLVMVGGKILVENQTIL